VNWSHAPSQENEAEMGKLVADLKQTVDKIKKGNLFAQEFGIFAHD
jgi:hypothetical protein